ncbi:MAG: glycosyltransferase family 4 protein [Planctomycetota bacterium]
MVVSPFGEQAGGAELSLVHLLSGGSMNGVTWSLAVPCDGGIASAARAGGVEVEIVNEARVRQVARFCRGINRIRRLSRRVRADLILSWMPHSHWWGMPAGKLAGVPTAWFQKDRALPDRRTTRWTASLPCRAILANSLYTARLQSKMSPKRPIHVVPSGVDIERFDPDRLPSPRDCRRELGLPPDGPLIGIVGRLQAWKGIETVIRALALVRQTHAAARLVIVGGPHGSEPDHPAELRSIASEVGVLDRLTFTGAVPHDDVPHYMQACDVLVHASRLEPFGIVVVEALALGKPLVAANSGGPRHTVTDGVDGLLAPFADHDALARQLSRLLNGGPEVEAVGRRARETAAAYSVDVFRQRMAAAVHDIVEARPAGIWMDGRLIEPDRVEL